MMLKFGLIASLPRNSQFVVSQRRSLGGGGGGGGNPGVMGAGGLLEAGYSKGMGAGRNGKNFVTLTQYFAIGKAHRGGNCYRRGREAGSLDPLLSPHPPPPELNWRTSREL